MKKSKKVKGMTLIECIIALFVFGVMAVMMAVIVTSTCRFLMNANHTTNKTVKEAPVAAAIITETDQATDLGNVTITVPGSSKHTINAKKYQAKLEDETNPFYQSGMDANLQFYEVEHATEAPTS